MSHRCEYCDTAHNQMPGWSHVVKPNGSHLWWCRVQEGMWTFAIGVRVVVDERGPLITWIARPERGPIGSPSMGNEASGVEYSVVYAAIRMLGEDAYNREPSMLRRWAASLERHRVTEPKRAEPLAITVNTVPF